MSNKMTRGHFRRFAQAVADQYREDVQHFPNPYHAQLRREAAVAILVKVCAQSNHAFDELKFRQACGILAPYINRPL